MLVKVNNVCSVAQAARLAPRVDMLGLRIGARDEPPCVSLATARAIRDAIGPTLLAVATDNQTDLEYVGASHYDFIPVDYAKAEAFDAEVRRLRAIALPKIALGYFVLDDDRGFIAEHAPFERLRDAGVELFQLEVEASAVEDAELFCRRFPCLTSGAPVSSSKGTYFDLRARVGDVGVGEADIMRHDAFKRRGTR